MPLIGNSETAGRVKENFKKASEIKATSSLEVNGNPANNITSAVVDGEVVPITDTLRNDEDQQPVQTMLEFQEGLKDTNERDWHSILETALSGGYELAHLFKQEAEEIEKGLSLVKLKKWLPEKLISRMLVSGVSHLYSYQEQAFKLILEANDVVITAPTGAGKTEAFLLPVLSRYYLEKNSMSHVNGRKGVKVLIIYPTKALAADQFSKFQRFLSLAGLRVELFDGDTSKVKRRTIMADPPTALITNMDILHYNLRKHQFRQMLHGLETVILDEVHTYAGLLGTNLKWILERLERFVEGEYFQIIAASATVANAEELVSLLARRPVKRCHCFQGRRTTVYHALITRDSSVEEKPSDLIVEKAKLVVLLTALSRSKVLVFEDSRRKAEEIYQHACQYQISNTVPGSRVIKIGVHHAGISPYERKKAEKAFKNDQLDLLIATPTMELGIDIGNIDIIVSSPVRVNRLVQRFGRGGRSGQSCLAITDLSLATPINEYYKNHPEEFVGSVSPVFFDPHSEKIGIYQLLSAIKDKPLGKKENFYIRYGKTVDQLLEGGLLTDGSDSEGTDRNVYITREGETALKGFNIRGIEESIDVILRSKPTGKFRTGQHQSVITSRETPLAIREFYPGATVLISGNLYLVEELDMERRKAFVVPFPKTRKSYYTRPRVSREVSPLRTKGNVDDGKEAITYLTDVSIITTTTGYVRIEYGNNRTRLVELDESIRHEIRSRGLVINVGPVLRRLGSQYDHDAWHGLAHLIMVFSELICGARSFGDIEYVVQRDMLLIHENSQGGRGVVINVQQKLLEIIEKGLESLSRCKCSNGCPSCLFIHGCRKNNKEINKFGTITLVKTLLQLLAIR